MIKRITAGVFAIPLGFVNAFLIEQNDDAGSILTLIDSGMAGNCDQILAAVRELGRQPEDLRHILVTHLHTDHTGSLAAIREATGAEVWMHAADAAMIRQGIAGRAIEPRGGVLKGLLKKTMLRDIASAQVQAVEVAHEFSRDETLPVAGGMRAIPIAGHTAGHTVYLWPQQGGVLFVGDALTRFVRLGGAPIYEDFSLAQANLLRLAELDFDVLCFSHGSPMVGKASEQVHAKILALARQTAG